MKKLYLLLLFNTLTLNIFCQSRDISVTYSSYQISGQYFESIDLNTLKEVNYNFKNALLNLNYGYYIPLVKSGTEISLGIFSACGIGFLINSSGVNRKKIQFDFDLPVTANFKLGAGSTKFSSWPLGFGIGFGFRPNMFIAEKNIFRNNHSNIFYTYVRPYFTCEMVFDFLKGEQGIFDNLKLQFAYQPKLEGNTFDIGLNKSSSYSMNYFRISLIKFSLFN